MNRYMLLKPEFSAVAAALIAENTDIWRSNAETQHDDLASTDGRVHHHEGQEMDNSNDMEEDSERERLKIEQAEAAAATGAVQRQERAIDVRKLDI